MGARARCHVGDRRIPRRYKVLHEHSGAVEALLYLPVVVLAFLMWAGVAAGRGDALAIRFVADFEKAPAPLKVAALLMMVSAAVHLGLAPAHWAEQPSTAILLVLDAVALTALSFFLLARRRWAVFAATTVLVAAVIAYGGYLVAGLETPDAIGIITNLVELGAIGLLAAAATTHSFTKGVLYR